MLTISKLLVLVLAFGCIAVNGFLTPSTSTTATTKQSGGRRPFRIRPVQIGLLQEERVSPSYLGVSNVTLKFPSYLELMNCAVGECVDSEAFVCGNATFCVKLYPRAGGRRTGSSSSSNQVEQGFGMAYKVLPVFGDQGNRNQRLGMYLQYLGSGTVDATFALRLKGNQKIGPRFDVEWRAGMRFVSSDAETKLGDGRANDFGAHLMQTPFLQEFMGISDNQLDDPLPLTANVEVVIHDTFKEILDQNERPSGECGDRPKDTNPESFFGLLGKDIRVPEGSSTKDSGHDGRRVRVGKVIVPILSKLNQRPKMFEQGAYPGVEYRILRILDPNGQERFTSCPGCKYELRPIYPLVSQLERPWPVLVPEADIPKLYTPNMYNAASAIGSLLTAITGLATAFLVSQAVSFFLIPSRSMDPTLEVGDVLLVDKVSPRLFKNRKPGEIILFSPPEELRAIVATNGGTLTSRDLFIKRIAAQAGDRVSVTAAGRVQINGQPAPGRRDLCEAEPLRLIERYVKAKEQTLAKEEYFLMGDCSSVSIDSRVWGPLQSSEIVGRPIVRLWPLDRFGPLASLPPSTTGETWQD